MTELESQGDYERHAAENIAWQAKDIDRMCQSRLKDITDRLSVEQEPFPRAHLTTLRRLVHFLALQTIDPIGHPAAHPQMGAVSEPGRYRLQRYFIAVEKINAEVARAAQSPLDTVRLRESLTGFEIGALPPRRAMPAKPFYAAILNQDAIREGVFSDAAMLLANLPLLDHLPHEGVAVRLAEFDKWAADAGVAEPDEVSRLLRDADARMWHRQLALHDELARLAQDEEAEAAARAAGMETAADELKRLHASAAARGRVLDPAIIASAEVGGATRHTINPPRRNILDDAIDAAVLEAGSHDANAVFLRLREMALSEEKPFTGQTQGGALLYTDSNDNVKSITKEALKKRLSRRVPPLSDGNGH